MSHIYAAGIEEAIKKLEDPERVKKHNPHLIFSRLGLSRGMSVADFGCGTGFYAIPAAQMIGNNGIVYAVDQVGPVLDVLRGKLKQKRIGNVKVLESDLCVGTPIPNGSIDLVIMGSVFHHVRSRALPETRRILKPSGRLCIIDWKKIQTVEGPPLIEKIGIDEVTEILSANGWKVLEKFDVSETHYSIVASLDRAGLTGDLR